METIEQSKPMSSAVKGLLIALVLIVLQVAAQFGHFMEANWFKFIPTIVLTVALILGCIHYTKQMQHNVTFGNVFGYGFRTSMVAALIVIVFTVLMFVLFPEFKEEAIQKARIQMENDPKLSADTIEKALTLTKKFFIPFAIGGVLIVYAIVGLIASVLGAAVAKKNPRSI